MTPIVSIIIPHWNGIQILSECLDTLKESTYTDMEIIVVDNASTDGSPEWVREHHPHVVLVQLDRNSGYAGGCNRGVEMASGKYVLFLNNDTIQDRNWLEPLVELMDRESRVAAVQPKILNYYETDRFDYAGGSGGHMDVLAYPYVRGRVFLHRETDIGQYDQVQSIFWASGTAILVRKDLFKAAGGFDEIFFAHMEEIDLCWRLRLMGYDIQVEPRSIIFHKNALTLPMFTVQKYYLNHRNSFLMLCTNYSRAVSLYLFLFRFVLEWIAFAYALVKWDWKHMLGIIRSMAWLLFHPQVIWKKRAQVKALRVIRDRDLMKSLYRGSVVLAHYLGRKKTYSEIVSKPRE